MCKCWRRKPAQVVGSKLISSCAVYDCISCLLRARSMVEAAGGRSARPSSGRLRHTASQCDAPRVSGAQWSTDQFECISEKFITELLMHWKSIGKRMKRWRSLVDALFDAPHNVFKPEGFRGILETVKNVFSLLMSVDHAPWLKPIRS